MPVPPSAPLRGAAHTLGAPGGPEHTPAPTPAPNLHFSAGTERRLTGSPPSAPAQGGETHSGVLTANPITHVPTIKHYQRILFFNIQKRGHEGRRFEMFKAAKAFVQALRLFPCSAELLYMLNSTHFFLRWAGSDTSSSPPLHDRLFHKQQLTFCNHQHDLASIASFKIQNIL